MANLRIQKIRASDIRTVKARFTDNLNPSINKSNISIESLIDGVPSGIVESVQISGSVLTAKLKPLTPQTAYLVKFRSTDSVSFNSLDGSSTLLEDGNTNVVRIIGPEEPRNVVRDNLISLLKDNVYNLNRGALVRSVLNQLSSDFIKAQRDIKQLRSDNYLKFTVLDEQKTRGRGPFDRLGEEGVFDVIRVGKNKTDENLTSKLSFTNFPSHLITLLRKEVKKEELEPGIEGVKGTFDRFVLTVNNSPVTKLTSVVFKYQDGTSFTYDISTLGYQILEPKYDPDFGSTLRTLDENQFKLNDDILSDSDFVLPAGGDKIEISYEFKSLGRVIDSDSVKVFQILDAVREAVSALSKEFNLKNAPIVTANGNIATKNGVTFLDPKANPPFSKTHPAFKKEVPLNFSGLPSNPGEFAINYSTGKVFVFGESEDNLGTGNFPPTATYKFEKIFRKNLDYTFDEETSDLAANPLRELSDKKASISFNHEETLVPGIDFKANVHEEIIDERIENRLLTTGSLRVKNTPITNAFRIFNETSGEVYGVTRFNDNTVFFSSNTPPKISDKNRERASFTNISNETLIIDKELQNSSGVRIFRFSLENKNIIAATEDAIGSSFNTSAQFSRNDLFSQELYFDEQIQTVSQNIDSLNIGQYQINYKEGIVYLGVSSTQGLNLGTISYKKPVIEPENPHVLAVSEIFHSISSNRGVEKRIQLSSFADSEIIPATFDRTDERFIDEDTSQPFVFSGGNITVNDNIKSIRGIFDAFDLTNNVEPINFAPSASFSGNVITLDNIGIEKRETLIVGSGLTLEVEFVSPGIVIGTAKSAIRQSDGKQLLDGYETISGNTITLAASSGANVGDVVDLLYTVVLNGASTPVVDYNRGDYFVDYTFLEDEILVSYEFGDNSLDFREASNKLEEGDEYFVSYRAGALRDSLLQNFGTLVDLPAINAFDVDLPREVYRGALIGALQSFTKGPTIPAFKKIVSSLTKIDPEITEAVFDVWSLGVSRLFRRDIKLHGEPKLESGKFDQGLKVDKQNQGISFPISSNLRLNEGSLEFWAIPDWDGLANDATLTFSSLKRDGYDLSANQIFIGASSFNPTIEDNKFSVNRSDDLSPVGLPSAVFTKTGVFIFFDSDINRWKVLAKDKPSDGYTYSGTIESSGDVYDVKFIENLGEPNDVLQSAIGKIDFEFNLDVLDKESGDGYDGYDGYSATDGYIPGFSFDGISFLADDEHYFFDFGEDKSKNRFSILKDGRGYLVFRVFDKGKILGQKSGRRNNFEVSKDISNWKAGEKHHIATSWKINTSEHRDELHLFVDGQEVPNIIRYGGRPASSSTIRFRTVDPELVAGTISKKTITNNDLTTTSGSPFVTSDSVNFQNEGIVAGDTIDILEQGFGDFNIVGVTENTLELDAPLSASLDDARFSVNPFSAVVSTEIDLFSNIAVSILSGGIETEIPGIRAEIPSYSISKNALNENVLTILGNADAGDQILIRTLGLNHRRCRERVFLWGTQSVLKTSLPPPINLNEVSIKAVLLPLLSIGPNNSTLVGDNFVATGIETTQPTNSTEGRTLEARITGQNVDFSTPTQITIDGYTEAGSTTETLTFNSAGKQSTTNKFTQITSVSVTTNPINPNENSIAVEIKEEFSLLFPNGNEDYPVVRFAIKTQTGNTLQGTGDSIVTDPEGFFPESIVGDLLVIESPSSVAGTFTIEDWLDSQTIRLNKDTGASFSDGKYSTFNISIGRSGFQNGFFFLQKAGSTNEPFEIPQGVYEFDFSAYLEIPFNPVKTDGYIGNSFNLNKPSDSVIDEFRILSKQLTDTRIGETLDEGEESFTTSFNSLNEFSKDFNTLMLLHFNSFPLINDSDYFKFANNEFIQSSSSVNSSFGESIVIKDKGLIFDNKNRLTTKEEGSIEFWVSPKFDTFNDPNIRMYFDAASSVFEEVVSISKGTVKVSGRISEVLSVRLATDDDETGTDFFIGGSVASDRKTINLGTALPFQKTKVKVAFIPSGFRGDRISIFKDEQGMIAFNVRADGKDFQVRNPVFWTRDSWHRIRATYKFNSQDNQDEIRLFVDGEERGIILFGSGLIFGTGVVFGQARAGVSQDVLIANIDFNDIINQFFVGMDFKRANGAQARIDNLRLSNISRDPLVISGQIKDVNFNSNLSVSLPVISDAFTTFLLDFERLIEKSANTSILRNSRFGIFNFTIKVIDSFDIVSNNARVRQILDEMLLALKPANSKATIEVVQ